MFQTMVTIKGAQIRVLPDKETTWEPGILLRTGDDSWELMPCKSNEDMREKAIVLHELGGALANAGARLRKSHPRLADSLTNNPMAMLELVAQDPEVLAVINKQRKAAEIIDNA
jgi:hypothetical protein